MAQRRAAFRALDKLVPCPAHGVDLARTSADIVRDWFVRARALAPDRMTSWTRSIGGCAFEFRCADPAMAAAIAPRFDRHTSNGGSQLRLDFIETDVFGWPAPPGDRASVALHRALAEDGISAVVLPSLDTEAGAMWVVFDTRSEVGLVVARTRADLPAWAVNAPFSLALHLAFAWRGARFLHGATLGLDGWGALIAGAGGAGKSATTISGLMQGLSTVGDDYVVVEFGETPQAWPVYRTLKQTPAALDRFPALRERTAAIPLNWHGKVEFDVDLVRPDCMAPRMTIGAILIPRQDGRGTTSFEPATPTAAFSALAPSTFSQLPGAGPAGFAHLTRLTRQLPAFRLHLGSDPAEIGASIRAFLERRGS